MKVKEIEFIIGLNGNILYCWEQNLDEYFFSAEKNGHQ